MIAGSDAAHAVLQAALQPGEVMRVAGDLPHIVYYRCASKDRPLAVFLPGGGHLARVAYGHQGADPRDFIDGWLAKDGYGLLALSYPSDHAAFSMSCPDVTIPQWASSVAESILLHVREFPCREIVVLGWSMAGRSAVALARALHARRLNLACFVSLAATAPLPNLLPASAAQERFTSEGFWDSSTRHEKWLQQVELSAGASGRPAIDAQTYLTHYVVNSPFRLRGQTRQATAGSEALLAAEIGAFSYEDYPPVAAIIPESIEDRLHAMTDCALWGTINVLRIAHGVARGLTVDATRWTALLALLAHVPQRLSRTIPGGHFFFLGEGGAKATVRHVVELTNEARMLRDELRSLIGAKGPSHP
jgi:thioesterase domain-containing protein